MTIFGNKSSLTHGRSSTTTWEEDKKRSSAHFQANLSLVDENDWMELGLEVICHKLKRTSSVCSTTRHAALRKSFVEKKIIQQLGITFLSKRSKRNHSILWKKSPFSSTISYNINQKIRTEPFLTIFSEKWSFLTKIDYARPQEWPQISEFSILWGQETLHYKLRPQWKNLAKRRWRWVTACWQFRHLCF